MRKQILSYGGGVQSVGIVAMIISGIIEAPDNIIMADTSREAQSTFDYLDEIVSPTLNRVGLTVNVASHDLSTVDLYAHNGDLLLPMWTPTGKMPTFCSVEWKERVIKRWLKANGIDFCEMWLGFSLDEKSRAKQVSSKWYKRRFPLIEKMMTRHDCISAIKSMGWPEPPKSACWMCPNRNDADWLQLYPADLKSAIELEEEIREYDPDLFLHHSRIPLRDVVFNTADDKEKHVQCGFGYCFL